MAKWLHVGVRRVEANFGGTDFYFAKSNEALRLQPPVPSGSQRTVGNGVKMLGKL